MTARRAAILDRDGTIVAERNYLTDPRELELLPGAAEALKRLSEAGLALVVITNQSAIGRGLLDEQGLTEIHGELRRQLASEGVSLDGIYFCPHLPDQGCACRKPGTALLERASSEIGFDPGASFVIGDKVCDVELGRRAGATTLLVKTGYGAEVARDPEIAPDFVVTDLGEAAVVIQDLLAAPAESARRSP